MIIIIIIIISIMYLKYEKRKRNEKTFDLSDEAECLPERNRK